MSPFLDGFLKEAAALSALKGLGKLTMKHPMLMMGIPAVGIGTAISAKEGYKRGRQGGEGERYLPAAYDPISRQAMASRAAYTNYNPLFRRGKPTKKEKKRLHGNYKEKAFA